MQVLFYHIIKLSNNCHAVCDSGRESRSYRVACARAARDWLADSERAHCRTGSGQGAPRPGTAP